MAPFSKDDSAGSARKSPPAVALVLRDAHYRSGPLTSLPGPRKLLSSLFRRLLRVGCRARLLPYLLTWLSGNAVKTGVGRAVMTLLVHEVHTCRIHKRPNSSS